MAESRPKHRESAISGDQAAGLPVSALLSQALVAFTIEFDNDFELRMHNAGFPGSRLSLVVWANLMRFLCDGECSVSDLARDALTSPERLKHQLGCLERWGFIVTHPNPDAVRPTPKREATRRHPSRRLRQWPRDPAGIGSFASRRQARKQQRFGSHCLGKSKDAGRRDSANGKSMDCGARCEQSSTKLSLNCHTGCRPLCWGSRRFRPASRTTRPSSRCRHSCRGHCWRSQSSSSANQSRLSS